MKGKSSLNTKVGKISAVLSYSIVFIILNLSFVATLKEEILQSQLRNLKLYDIQKSKVKIFKQINYKLLKIPIQKK